ncbi:MAG TPA: hypothetical protein VIT20_00905 [Propionibacteriaceae bacterium]
MTNATTSRTSAGRTHRTRRVVRSLALTLAAGAVASAAVGLGQGPSLAQADPGDTFVAIGSSQIVQSEDLVSIQIKLDTETVTLNRNNDFSACIGEGNRWTDVLPGAKKPVTAAWNSRSAKNKALYESIGQAETPAVAKSYANTLLKAGVRACQGTKSPYDFHYGPTESSSVGDGYATWAVSYRGTSTKPDGGVAIIRKGDKFGIVQVSGTWGPADQMMESVAKVAVDRLR